MKAAVLFSILLFMSCLPAKSQTRRELEIQYQNKLGDYASLFKGKVEVPYDVHFFKNLPYLNEDGSFRQGTVFFGQMLYEKVNLRLDLYQNQLVVESPQGRHKVIPQKEKISFFIVDGQKFANVQGMFVREEYSGGKISLFSHLYKEQDVADTQQNYKRIQFKSKSALWLRIDDDFRIIHGKRDLLAYFPSQRQEIIQFLKNENLKFNARNRLSSIKAIIKFIDR